MNTRLHHCLIAAACTLLAACSSKEDDRSTDPLAFPAEEEEIAYIPTYSKSVIAGWPKGRSLDPHDISRVRLGEQVHTYHVGRLPSHDRREMHEAHSVYRLEQEARWDTRLPATPMESRGVVLGIIEPSRNAVPKDTLVAQERESLMAKTRQLETTMTRLSAMQKDLEKKRNEFTEAEGEMQQIRIQLAETIQKRDETKALLDKASARIEELEEADRYRLKTSNQGFIVPKKTTP